MKQLIGRFLYYAREAFRVSRENPSSQSLPQMLRLFPRWNQSLERTPIQERVPWISYAAIEFLERVLKPEMRAFEWGAGGSTLFFAGRVGELISVEHDQQWAESVRAAMQPLKHPSWQLLVVSPTLGRNGSTKDLSNPQAYASAAEGCGEVSFEEYVKAIDQFPEESFDLVLVDGRCRTACAMHGIPKIKPGGYLIVDDMERPHYGWIHEQMARLGWKPLNLSGPGPCVGDFKQTTGWQRLTASLNEPVTSRCARC